MKYFATILLLLVTFSANATTIYVADTATGDGSGSSPSNRKQIQSVSPSAGDTVSLGGTFPTNWNIGFNGSAGNPITILFESGAKFSSGCFSNNVIYLHDISNLTIDGGSNGLMENTDNGNDLSYKIQCNMIYLDGTCLNIEIKNLSISNVWQRVQDQDMLGGGQGIAMNINGGKNISIHNCAIGQVGNAVVINHYGNCTNVQVYSNTLFNCSWGVGILSSSPGFDQGFKVWANNIDGLNVWDDPANANHNDGIIYSVDAATGTTNYDFEFYGNKIGPHLGAHCSSAIFTYVPGYEFHSPNFRVYNNVLSADSSSHFFDGLLSIGFNDALVANNTFTNVSAFGGFMVRVYDNSGVVFLNNDSISGSGAIYEGSGSACDATTYFQNIDYNNYPAGVVFKSGGYSWFDWRFDVTGCGFDVNSSTNRTTVGTNLTAFFTTDYYGNTRPASGAWTIGAIESGTNSPPPTADSFIGYFR